MNINFGKILTLSLGILFFFGYSYNSHAAYYLQLGAFKTKANAQKLYEKAQSKIKQPLAINQLINKGAELYIVQVGPYNNFKEANLAKHEALKSQMNGIIVGTNTVEKPGKVVTTAKATTTEVKKEPLPVYQQPPKITNTPTIINQPEVAAIQEENLDRKFTIALINDEYFIQLGNYAQEKRAKQVQQLASKTLNLPVSIKTIESHGRSLYSVRVGPFIDLDEAISYRKLTANELTTVTSSDSMQIQNQQSVINKQQYDAMKSRANQKDNQSSNRKISKVARFKKFFG